MPRLDPRPHYEMIYVKLKNRFTSISTRFLYSEAQFILCIIVFSIILFWTRFFNLSSSSFNCDEANYPLRGVQFLHKPFSHVGSHYWWFPDFICGLSVALFGRNDFAARLPFAIVEVFSCFFIYLFVKKLSNKYYGLLASFLYATSPLMISWSGIIFRETFMIFFYIVTLYCFWVGFEEEKRNYIILGGSCLGISFFTLPVNYVLVIMLLIFILLYYRHLVNIKTEKGFTIIKIRSYLICFIFVTALSFALGFLPFILNLPAVFYNIAISIRDWTKPTPPTGFSIRPWWYYINWYFGSYPLPTLLAYMFGVGWALYHRKKSHVYLFLSILFPFLIFSFLINYKYFKYALTFEPGLTMLATLAIYEVFKKIGESKIPRFKKNVGKVCITAFTVSLIVIGGITASQINQTNYHMKEGGKTASQYLYKHTDEGETILVWGYPQIYEWYMPNRNITGWFGPSENRLIDQTIEKGHIRFVVVNEGHIERWPNDPIILYIEKQCTRASMVYSCPSPDGQIMIYQVL